MHYKKKNNYKSNIKKNNNYIIDNKGQKRFWLKERVSRKEFKLLKFKFNFVHKR